MPDRFLKKLFQIGKRGIGVGVGLEIGDEIIPGVFGGDALSGRLNLFGDGSAARFGKIAGSAVAAEDAAAGSQRSVPVGAGHAAVQGEAVEFFSELIPDESIERIIGPSVRIERGFCAVHAVPPFCEIGDEFYHSIRSRRGEWCRREVL